MSDSIRDSITLPELAAIYVRHVEMGNAEIALRLQTELVRRTLADRWPLVRAALRLGSQLAAIGKACDLDEIELRVGLTRWGHVQHVAGNLTDAENAEILTLLAGAR